MAGPAIFASPALATNQTVHAVGAAPNEYGTGTPDLFSPATVRVLPGESVTWVNDGGVHNVRFDDGLFQMPAAPAAPAGWPVTAPARTFTQVGSYRFYCEMHGGPNGYGMSGVVLVGAQTRPPPKGAPGTGGGSPTNGATAKIESLTATRGRFCNRGGPRCRRPGVRLRIDLSQPAHVLGVLKRRPLHGPGRARRFGMLDFGTVAADPKVLRFRRTRSGRRLGAGRYALTVKAGQDTRVVRFKVGS